MHGEIDRLPEAIRRRFAILLWRRDKRAEDPNLFFVAYAEPWRGYGGFRDYSAYRASREWKAIKRRVLDAANNHCLACGGRATQVHHRDYRPRVLAGEDMDALVPLCGPCHIGKVEKVRKDLKAGSWQQADKLLIRLVLEHEERARI